MGLFGFGKKEEKTKVEASCCCGGAQTSEVKAESSCCCNEEVKGICCIKVLGAGCKSCHDQYQNVINAVAEKGIITDVQYITDMEKIAAYGVMSMPAIVINENIVSMGKVLKSDEVIKLIEKLGF